MIREREGEMAKELRSTGEVGYVCVCGLEQGENKGEPL